jgi:hypothetical protein
MPKHAILLLPLGLLWLGCPGESEVRECQTSGDCFALEQCVKDSAGAGVCTPEPQDAGAANGSGNGGNGGDNPDAGPTADAGSALDSGPEITESGNGGFEDASMPGDGGRAQDGAFADAAFIDAGPQDVTVSISADATGLNAGQSTTLHWSSTDATSCTLTPSAPGGLGMPGSGVDGGLAGIENNGSVEIFPTESTTYEISCQGQNGPATDEVTVYVSSIDTLDKSVGIVEVGNSVTITWSTTGTSDCTLAQSDGSNTGISGGDVDNGMATVTPTQTTTYRLSCTSVGTPNTITRDVVVRVLRIVRFEPDDESVRHGDDAVIEWEVEEASFCNLTSDVGGISEVISDFLSSHAHVPTEDTNYTLTCFGDESTQAVAMTSIYQAVTITDVTLTAAAGGITFSWDAVDADANGCTVDDNDTFMQSGLSSTSGTVTDPSPPPSTSFPTYYNLECTGVGGTHLLTFRIWGGNFNPVLQTNANILDSLHAITGALTVNNRATITTLDGALLMATGDSVSISDNDNLTFVSFPELVSVGEDLGIANNALLNTLNLDKIETIPGFLNILDNPELCESQVTPICTTNCTASGINKSGQKTGC